MKNILLASSILALSTGFAAAQGVTLSGDARMGIIDGFGTGDAVFTSRARVKFTLSGETDGGLSFGASFRADNAKSFIDGNGVVQGGANAGTAGSVFISGAFGKLTMGDIDGAAQQAVGNVDGVGLTGLSDLNEAVYVHNLVEGLAGDFDPSAAYEYTAGAFTGIISITNPSSVTEVLALGMKYTTGDYTFALGYEDSDVLGGISHIIIGGSATFGAVTVKANYGQAEAGGTTANQYHLSAVYAMDALSVTAFVSDEEDFGIGTDQSYGIGAAYDLGGGAKIVGGYANNDDGVVSTDAFDVGVAFEF